jgi:hypothetical protein
MSIVNFLLQLRREISLYTSSIKDIENTITDDNRYLKILKFETALSLYKVIEYYFTNTSISGDENCMTQDEINVVISKLNNIMDTYLYTDFT